MQKNLKEKIVSILNDSSIDLNLNLNLNTETMDIYEFGCYSLFCYDSKEKKLIRIELSENFFLSKTTQIQCFDLNSIGKEIYRMIPNENETILVLIDEEYFTLICLPKFSSIINSDNENYPLHQIKFQHEFFPSIHSKENQFQNFLWLTNVDFLHIDSLNNYHFYRIEIEKKFIYKHIQELKMNLERKRNSFENQISMTRTIQLLVIQYSDNNFTQFMILSLMSNGFIFLLKIDQNYFLQKDFLIKNEFLGPIDFYSKRKEKSSMNFNELKMICLSSKPIVLLIQLNPFEIDQTILLNHSEKNWSLHLMNQIRIDQNEKSRENFQTFGKFLLDRFHSDRCYFLNHFSNLYQIQLNHIEQLSQGQFSIDVQQLMNGFHSNYFIRNFKLNQKNFHSNLFIFLLQHKRNSKEKKLIQFNKNRVEFLSLSIDSLNNYYSIQSNNDQHQFLQVQFSFSNQIQQILSRFNRKQNSDDHFHEIQTILSNKLQHLSNYQQIQFIQYQRIQQRVEELSNRSQSLIQSFSQEFHRLKQILRNFQKKISNEKEIDFNQIRIQLKQIRHELNQRQSIIDSLLKQSSMISSFQQNSFDKNSMKSIEEFLLFYFHYLNQMKNKFFSNQ